MITARGVCLSAPDLRATGPPLLDDVSLSIRSDEYVALVGPNGAGKSLLLQVLAGLRPPGSGDVVFESPHVSIGIVFQTPDDQIVGSTVERELAFGLENHEVAPGEIRRRVDGMLARTGLAPLAQRAPHLLSDGEKQRVALASTLILEPNVLLLDEPTSRLDPPSRRRLGAEIQAARERTGAAVVHVTHRSEEVVLADRVVGLAAGRVVFDGTPVELLGAPEADRLGILWSGLHRLRRELVARGLTLPEPAGADWNRVDPLLALLPR